jgi:hypothetical protein
VKRLATELLTDPEINPAVTFGHRRGKLAVDGVDTSVLDVLQERKFRTGNFRELIDVLAAGVATAVEHRSTVVIADDLPAEAEVLADARAFVDPIAVEADLPHLVERFGPPVPVDDLTRLARSERTPLFRTTDDHLVTIWSERLWIGSPT